MTPAGDRLPQIDSVFEAEDRRTRELVRDLHYVQPRIYWTDLLLTSFAGWTAFVLTVYLPFSPPAVLTGAVAVAALYRGLSFIHEITHQSGRVLPHFELVWNLLIGYPLLIPSFAYSGVHQSHHSLSTYGTSEDPEYLPFARSRVMTVLFAAESFFIPLVLIVRFFILAPAGFVSSRLQKWLVVHFSALTMNVAYRRNPVPELIRRVRLESALVLIFWVAPSGLAAAKILPWKFFVVWLLVSSAVSFVNTLRTLGAHAYRSEGTSLSRKGQLIDSIDTPGAVWTEIWAPVGLRYHALHHYFPGIPYHNLPRAWRRVAASLPPEALFHRVTSRGLRHSLKALLSGTHSGDT